jgi:distribution and morphology protein 12
MSIDIDWEALTTGPDGLALEQSIRDFIHDRFQQIDLPRFIQSVQVHSFEFGDVPPEICLVDIRDPLPEYYQDDEETENEDEAVADEEPATTAKESACQSNTRSATLSERRQQRRSFTKQPRQDTGDVPDPIPRMDFRPANLRSLNAVDSVSSPVLGVNTPGIPGGTSNLGYFHLPLSAGLRSGTQTPLAAVAGAHFQRPSAAPPLHQSHQRSSISSTNSSIIAPPSPPVSPPLPQDTSRDFQAHFHVQFSGPIHLSLTADILLDYPMPSFVGIPMRLTVTGITFDGQAILAMMFRKGNVAEETDQNKACFCFIVTPPEGGNVAEQGLLREIKVETEIGRRDDGRGQSLKNVGKVEKFVLEQVRKVFEEELVWPSFWTFLI